MVELALAIAVLAVATASVMSLFFVGIEQNKNSIGDNYSAISSDDILHTFPVWQKLISHLFF